MTIDELIEELKALVNYDKEKDKHYMGSTILTNQEVHHILTVTVGKEYTELNGSQRTKVRQRVFKELM